MAKPFVFIYGNCQMERIEQGLALSPELTEKFQLYMVPNFKNFGDQSGAETTRRVEFFAKQAKNCRIFLYQNEFWDKNSHIIMNILPEGCIKVPMFSISLSSLWPFYFKDLAIRAVKTPAGVELFPYGDSFIAKAVKAGEEAGSILERYLALDVDDVLPLADWHKSNLDILRAKEERAVISVAKLIEEQFTDVRFHWTPNHPTNTIFRPIVDQLLRHLGYPELVGEDARQFGIGMGFGKQLHHPIHPSVIKALGLNYLEVEGTYKHHDDMLTFAQWAKLYIETAREVYGMAAA